MKYFYITYIYVRTRKDKIIKSLKTNIPYVLPQLATQDFATATVNPIEYDFYFSRNIVNCVVFDGARRIL